MNLQLTEEAIRIIKSSFSSHSPRLCSFLGSLVLGLGLLFTSFASRLHQILISQVIILSFGVSVLQSSHNVMLGKHWTINRNLTRVDL